MTERRAALRAKLGKFGIWNAALQRNPRTKAEAAIRAYESQGWAATWYSEGPIMDAFVQGALLLAPSSRMIVASGIASIYLRSPSAAAVAGRNLAEAYDDRFVLGIGVSHPPSVTSRGGKYGRPIETMRAYLDAMDATWSAADSKLRPPVVLAALGPRMLDLAAERAEGAHPYFMPVEHTRGARGRLGPDPVLAVEVTAVIDPDRSRSRATAQAFARGYLALENYVNPLRALGFEDEDLAGSGSDRLLDAVIVQGDVGVVAARVREHIEAGADHVCVQLYSPDSANLAIDTYAELSVELRD